jgi:DNA repair exonuclease SbcCD ATPase subunit
LHAALPISGGLAARLEQERERAGAPPAHFVEAQAEQGLWQELRDHGASLNRALNEALRIHSGPTWHIFQVSWISSNLAVPPPSLFRVRAFPDSFSSRFARWRQDLERQARERYDALDHLNADLHWYRGQYDALAALVEALRSPDRWLAYRAEALLDLPPEQDSQAAGDASAVERVRAALVEQDDALRKAREDLAGARSVAAAWEAEVAFAHAQLQQDRAALEEARAWHSKAEEKAKEAEGLRTTLASKATALAAAEEQLRQEGATRQQAETQLQREQAALAEAQAALERECLAQEEALGRLQ